MVRRLDAGTQIPRALSPCDQIQICAFGGRRLRCAVSTASRKVSERRWPAKTVQHALLGEHEQQLWREKRDGKGTLERRYSLGAFRDRGRPGWRRPQNVRDRGGVRRDPG